ncbi:hypothetical protein SteCoe_4721 [Stentor coeruleus]|uniref:CCDC66 domain-containing protein n=1 Tax=Stentor coeruleus TaxID=5963 RepID=A0A1R2CTY5_9CILI|nr:hypothetical protein SteCoe_4721 [Stentor coeruleus]
MSNPNFNKLSRDERWEARKRAKFSNENSFENPAGNSGPVKNPPAINFEPAPVENFRNIPETALNPISAGYSQQVINDPGNGNMNMIPINQPNPTLSPKQSLDNKRFIQQQENPVIRGRTPPSNSFFVNPVSDAELKRIKMQEEYKNFVQQDMNRKKEEVYEQQPANYNRGRGLSEQQQYEEEKKRQYNQELKRQIEEREANKRNIRQQDRAEEYFPFGRPGAGAPFRDQSGKIIAARPPKFNENDPNFNKPGARINQPVKANMDYFENYPPAYNNPGYAQPSYNPPSYNPSGQFAPPTNPYQQASYNNYPPNAAPPQQYPPYQDRNPPPYQDRNPPSYQDRNPPPYQDRNPPPYQDRNPPPRNPQFVEPPITYSGQTNFSPQPPLLQEDRFPAELDKGVDLKKLELQRALQIQIEEKKRQKEEEKRRKILEEKFEEDRLARERQQLQEEFIKEAEKKKKQINDLQSFNANKITGANNVLVVEPQRKGRRPRTPIDFPPPEPPKPMVEESKRRGQSALTRSPQQSVYPGGQNVYPPQGSDIYNPQGSNGYPPQESNIYSQQVSKPNEIPEDFISYLNSAVDRKLNVLKSEFKVQDLRQQEEITKLRQKNQANSEMNFEAQREIERLKDELRRKQMDEDIRHRELAMAMANTKSVIPQNTRLPPYEPRPLNLPRGNIDDASLSLDFAQRSLVSESKFIPLPNIQEPFPIKPASPKEKKALHLDTLFPSLPEPSSNYDTVRSSSSSIGIDNILKRNEERLKALDKINPDAQDELNKLDEILFKFSEADKKNETDDLYSKPVEQWKTPAPLLINKGDYLPSIKELEGDDTYKGGEAYFGGDSLRSLG